MTYDLLDGIRRDYNNKAISSNWRDVNVFLLPRTSHQPEGLYIHYTA